MNSEVTSADNIPSEFKVAKQGDIMLLPVKFTGKEYLFLLDTGASMTVFDISLKPELGDVKGIGRIQTAGGGMVGS